MHTAKIDEQQQGCFELTIGSNNTVGTIYRWVNLAFDELDAMRPYSFLSKLLGALSGQGYECLPLVKLAQKLRNASTFGSVQTITQRISRESAENCAIIEMIAKAQVDALVASGVGGVRIEGAHFLDQCSVRLLSRTGFRMDLAGLRLEIVSAANLFAAPGENDLAAIFVSGAWVAAFARVTVPIVTSSPNPISRVGMTPSLDINLAGVIELQAFDIAVPSLESEHIIDRPTNPGERLRILATMVVNNGGTDEALEILSRAADQSGDDRLVRSTVLYTKGLVLAKRKGDLDSAQKLFEDGIRLLKETSSSDKSAARLGEAWHLNGLALIDALRGKACTDQQARNSFFARAAFYLNRAMDLIAQEVGPHFDYLKQNLKANIAMLLEINDEHSAALRRFKGNFAKLANAQSAARPAMIYHFRLASLNYRAGEPELALQELKQSREHAVVCNAEHALGRIDLATAQVLVSQGRPTEAYDALESALEDGLERQFHGLVAAAANMATSIARPTEDRPDTLYDRAKAALLHAPPGIRAVATFPNKLPSYVPFIDLLSDTDSTNDRLTASIGK